MSETPRILLIGGGNMGRALVGGLLNNGWDAARIGVSDPDPSTHALLQHQFQLKRLYYDNTLAYAKVEPDVVLFAVKPGGLPATATDLAPWMVQEHPLLISIAAGVRSEDLARWTGGHCPVVRVMPNTPALVGAGMSVLYAQDEVSDAQCLLAEKIMQGLGETLWVEEETLMDAVTAVSGSGPAYFFAFMQAMMEGACKMGLSEQQARTLVLQTAFGAQRLAQESEDSLQELRDKVTSKGGTTAAAMAVLDEGRFQDLMMQALEAARQRSEELGDESSRA